MPVPWCKNYRHSDSPEIPLVDPPDPVFAVHWDEKLRVWFGRFTASPKLPRQIQGVFERTGYGSLAAETDIGMTHVDHTADRDIERYSNKPSKVKWQLIRMQIAPLIRLELVILDDSFQLYLFESFLKVAE
jgi:hypothetical protein